MPLKKYDNKTGWFQMNNITPTVRRAIRVAAAMDGVTMQDWVLKAAKAQLKRQGVIMESGGNSNGEEET